MSNSDELFEKFGKEFKKGTVLFDDGDTGTEMYIIQTGKVEIIKKVRDVEKTLVTLEAGDFFGEMATLNNKPRSAGAKVIEDSKLLVIDPDTFESMICNSNEVALRMIKKLAQRIQDADDQIENLLLKDNDSKVVTTLIKLAYDIGEDVENGIRIKISLRGLASQVGLEKEKVKESVKSMTRRGIVSVTTDSLIISSVQRLNGYLNFLAIRERHKKN